MPAPAPAFGKRQSSPRGSARGPGVEPIAVSPEHAAFLTAIRAETHEREDVARQVPRSGRAALLSGLVVGCALAGFDVTGGTGAAEVAAIGGALGIAVDPANLLPGLILLGLLGGARASAVTLVAVNGLLQRTGQTSHAAYAAAGAAAACVLAAATLVLFGHAPAHGWPLEAASGAAAGFFYRVFAGSRPA